MKNIKYQVQKWPTVLAIITFLYAMLYGLLTVGSIGANLIIGLLNIVIVGTMILGAIGLFLRKAWSPRTMGIASCFAILQAIYAIISICVYVGGPLPIFAMLGVITVLFPVIAWPIFLLIWFSRHTLIIPKEQIIEKE